VVAVLLFSAATDALAQANFWKDRRDATHRARSDNPGPRLAANARGGASSFSKTTAAPSVPLLAQLPRTLPVTHTLPAAPEDILPRSVQARAGDVAALPAPLLSILPRLNVHGVVRSVHPAPRKNGPVVLYVQDAHGVPSAQKNIAALLVDVLGAQPRALLALEGGAGPVAVEKFRPHPQDINAQVGAFFLNAGLISGAEYAVFGASQAPRAIGAEDGPLYWENVAALRQSLAQQPAALGSLKAMKTLLEGKKAKAFSPELRALDAQQTARAGGRATLTDYLAFLAARPGAPPAAGFPQVDLFLETLAIEKTLDFARVEKERAAALEALAQRAGEKGLEDLLQKSLATRAGVVSYAGFYGALRDASRRAGLSLDVFPQFERYLRYVAQSDAIHPESLFVEIDRFEEAVWRAACRTEEQKAAAALARDAALTEKLFNLTLTTDEWRRYQARRAHIRALPRRLTGEDASLPHETFERFYALAEKRNKALADNLFASLKDAPLAVLVAGGFHGDGLTKLLTRAGATLVTISPKMEIPAGHKGNSYMTAFTREKTPLEKRFASPKITIAKPLGVTDGPPDAAQDAATIAALARPVGEALALPGDSVVDAEGLTVTDTSGDGAAAAPGPVLAQASAAPIQNSEATGPTVTVYESDVLKAADMTWLRWLGRKRLGQKFIDSAWSFAAVIPFVEQLLNWGLNEGAAASGFITSDVGIVLFVILFTALFVFPGHIDRFKNPATGRYSLANAPGEVVYFAGLAAMSLGLGFLWYPAHGWQEDLMALAVLTAVQSLLNFVLVRWGGVLRHRSNASLIGEIDKQISQMGDFRRRGKHGRLENAQRRVALLGDALVRRGGAALPDALAAMEALSGAIEDEASPEAEARIRDTETSHVLRGLLLRFAADDRAAAVAALGHAVGVHHNEALAGAIGRLHVDDIRARLAAWGLLSVFAPNENDAYDKAAQSLRANGDVLSAALLADALDRALHPGGTFNVSRVSMNRLTAASLERLAQMTLDANLRRGLESHAGLLNPLIAQAAEALHVEDASVRLNAKALLEALGRWTDAHRLIEFTWELKTRGHEDRQGNFRRLKGAVDGLLAIGTSAAIEAIADHAFQQGNAVFIRDTLLSLRHVPSATLAEAGVFDSVVRQLPNWHTPLVRYDALLFLEETRALDSGWDPAPAVAISKASKVWLAQHANASRFEALEPPAYFRFLALVAAWESFAKLLPEQEVRWNPDELLTLVENNLPADLPPVPPAALVRQRARDIFRRSGETGDPQKAQRLLILRRATYTAVRLRRESGLVFGALDWGHVRPNAGGVSTLMNDEGFWREVTFEDFSTVASAVLGVSRSQTRAVTNDEHGAYVGLVRELYLPGPVRTDPPAPERPQRVRRLLQTVQNAWRAPPPEVERRWPESPLSRFWNMAPPAFLFPAVHAWWTGVPLDPAVEAVLFAGFFLSFALAWWMTRRQKTPFETLRPAVVGVGAIAATPIQTGPSNMDWMAEKGRGHGRRPSGRRPAAGGETETTPEPTENAGAPQVLADYLQGEKSLAQVLPLLRGDDSTADAARRLVAYKIHARHPGLSGDERIMVGIALENPGWSVTAVVRDRAGRTYDELYERNVDNEELGRIMEEARAALRNELPAPAFRRLSDRERQQLDAFLQGRRTLTEVLPDLRGDDSTADAVRRLTAYWFQDKNPGLSGDESIMIEIALKNPGWPVESVIRHRVGRTYDELYERNVDDEELGRIIDEARRAVRERAVPSLPKSDRSRGTLVVSPVVFLLQAFVTPDPVEQFLWVIVFFVAQFLVLLGVNERWRAWVSSTARAVYDGSPWISGGVHRLGAGAQALGRPIGAGLRALAGRARGAVQWETVRKTVATSGFIIVVFFVGRDWQPVGFVVLLALTFIFTFPDEIRPALRAFPGIAAAAAFRLGRGAFSGLVAIVHGGIVIARAVNQALLPVRHWLWPRLSPGVLDLFPHFVADWLMRGFDIYELEGRTEGPGFWRRLYSASLGRPVEAYRERGRRRRLSDHQRLTPARSDAVRRWHGQAVAAWLEEAAAGGENAPSPRPAVTAHGVMVFLLSAGHGPPLTLPQAEELHNRLRGMAGADLRALLEVDGSGAAWESVRLGLWRPSEKTRTDLPPLEREALADVARRHGERTARRVYWDILHAPFDSGAVTLFADVRSGLPLPPPDYAARRHIFLRVLTAPETPRLDDKAAARLWRKLGDDDNAAFVDYAFLLNLHTPERLADPSWSGRTAAAADEAAAHEEARFAARVAELVGLENGGRVAVLAELLLRRNERRIFRAATEIRRAFDNPLRDQAASLAARRQLGILLAGFHDDVPSAPAEMDQRVDRLAQALYEIGWNASAVRRPRPTEPPPAARAPRGVDGPGINFSFLRAPASLGLAVPSHVDLTRVHALAEHGAAARVLEIQREMGLYARDAESMQALLDQDSFDERLGVFYRRAVWAIRVEFQRQLDLLLSEHGEQGLARDAREALVRRAGDLAYPSTARGGVSSQGPPAHLAGQGASSFSTAEEGPSSQESTGGPALLTGLQESFGAYGLTRRYKYVTGPMMEEFGPLVGLPTMILAPRFTAKALIRAFGDRRAARDWLWSVTRETLGLGFRGWPALTAWAAIKYIPDLASPFYILSVILITLLFVLLSLVFQEWHEEDRQWSAFLVSWVSFVPIVLALVFHQPLFLLFIFVIHSPGLQPFLKNPAMMGGRRPVDDPLTLVERNLVLMNRGGRSAWARQVIIQSVSKDLGRALAAVSRAIGMNKKILTPRQLLRRTTEVARLTEWNARIPRRVQEMQRALVLGEASAADNEYEIIEDIYRMVDAVHYLNAWLDQVEMQGEDEKLVGSRSTENAANDPSAGPAPEDEAVSRLADISLSPMDQVKILLQYHVLPDSIAGRMTRWMSNDGLTINEIDALMEIYRSSGGPINTLGSLYAQVKEKSPGDAEALETFREIMRLATRVARADTWLSLEPYYWAFAEWDVTRNTARLAGSLETTARRVQALRGMRRGSAQLGPILSDLPLLMKRLALSAPEAMTLVELTVAIHLEPTGLPNADLVKAPYMVELYRSALNSLPEDEVLPVFHELVAESRAGTEPWAGAHQTERRRARIDEAIAARAERLRPGSSEEMLPEGTVFPDGHQGHSTVERTNGHSGSFVPQSAAYTFWLAWVVELTLWVFLALRATPGAENVLLSAVIVGGVYVLGAHMAVYLLFFRNLDTFPWRAIFGLSAATGVLSALLLTLGPSSFVTIGAAVAHALGHLYLNNPLVRVWLAELGASREKVAAAYGPWVEEGRRYVDVMARDREILKADERAAVEMVLAGAGEIQRGLLNGLDPVRVPAKDGVADFFWQERARKFYAQAALIVHDGQNGKPTTRALRNLAYLAGRIGLPWSAARPIVATLSGAAAKDGGDWLWKSYWEKGAYEMALPLRDHRFTPKYDGSDFHRGEQDKISVLYLNGLWGAEEEVKWTAEHAVAMAVSAAPDNSAPRVFAVRAPPMTLGERDRRRREMEAELYEKMVPYGMAPHLMENVRFLFVETEKLMTEDDVWDSLGVDEEERESYSLGFYTATMAGLDPSLADVIVWLLNGKRAVPLLWLLHEENRKDRVFGAHA